MLCCVHRSRFAGAVLNDRLYVIGGIAKFEGPTDAHVPLATVMEYNVQANRWTVLPGECSWG